MITRRMPSPAISSHIKHPIPLHLESISISPYQSTLTPYLYSPYPSGLVGSSPPFISVIVKGLLYPITYSQVNLLYSFLNPLS